MVGHYIIKLDEYKNSNLAQTANAAGTNNLQECHHKPVECNTHKHHFTQDAIIDQQYKPVINKDAKRHSGLKTK